MLIGGGFVDKHLDLRGLMGYNTITREAAKSVGKNKHKKKESGEEEEGGLLFMVGEDIQVSQKLNYSSKTLVGKLLGIQMLKETLNDWIQQT